MGKTLFEKGFAIDGRPLDPIQNLTTSFGGEERIKRIRRFLDRLRLHRASVKIISTSWFPVTEIQWKEYLINITNTFDMGFEDDEVLSLADPGPGLSANKGDVIKADMKDSNVDFDGALFSDDSKGNIKSAKGICNTVLLPKRLGLDGTDCAYVEALVGMKMILGFK